jgi:hypothetical protein
LITGGIIFLVGNGKISDSEKACPTRVNCLPQVAEGGNDGRTFVAVGGVMAGVGLAAVAGGLIWYFVQTPKAAETGKTRVTPDLGSGYAGIRVGGTF